MQKWIDQFSRFFVGGLLIFSGLIKLNDPIGTEIKMEEYFEVFAQDFGSFFNHFLPWSLEIGMFMIVLEIVLGVAILLNYRMKWTTWILLAMMGFFTFLTFYSAYFNKVTDCGCFGDAIKLTPWQSFWKDILIMVFVSHLFWYRRSYSDSLRSREGHAVVLATAAISLGVGIYAVRHLPYIDFRAYRVGNVIPQQMVAAEPAVIEYTFTKDGKETTSEKFLSAAEGYKYVSSRILNEDQAKPKITDYSVTSPEGEDMTKATFQGARLMIVITTVGKANTEDMAALRMLVLGLEGKVQSLILTASASGEMEPFRHEHQLAIPYAFTDATVLKTIIRSNPGIALWKDGKVLGNWNHRDLPTVDEVLDLLKP